jgi:hypothetical protein
MSHTTFHIHASVEDGHAEWRRISDDETRTFQGRGSPSHGRCDLGRAGLGACPAKFIEVVRSPTADLAI